MRISHFCAICVFKLADAGHSAFCIFAGELFMDKSFSKTYLAIFSFSCAVMFWYGVRFFCEAVDHSVRLCFGLDTISIGVQITEESCPSDSSTAVITLRFLTTSFSTHS